MREVKYVRKVKIFRIRFTSQLSMADFYHPSAIFFVHVHMKFYEKEEQVRRG
jgi:hypothetical protein